MNSKTLGIVIRRQDFSEADQILTVLTERFGKIKAIARGVRKISAKLAGSLEPFMLIELQLHEGKTFYTITAAAIKNSFSGIHDHLEKMASVFYLGELIDKFEKENQKSIPVFELLVETLAGVNLLHTRCEIGLHLRAFEIKLLKLSGLWGDLAACIHCHQKLEPSVNYWDGEEGGIICGICQKLFHHGRPISNGSIKLLRLLENCQMVDIQRIKVSPEVKSEIKQIVRTYLHNVLESNVRSESFLHELVE